MSLHETITADLHKLVEEAAADIITPASLAIALQQRYADDLEPRIQYLSLEHLKALARKVLARRFDAESDDADAYQGELFSGHLQQRYPLPPKRGQEPAYKALEALTATEVRWNVQMLRKSATARMLHADALEAWAQSHLVA